MGGDWQSRVVDASRSAIEKTRADPSRCRRSSLAVQVTGEAATGQLAASTAKMMYGDRETYPD